MNTFNRSTKDNTNDGFDHLRHNRPLQSQAEMILEPKPRKARIFTPDDSAPWEVPKSITAHGEM
jgi:hypothetical protein